MRRCLLTLFALLTMSLAAQAAKITTGEELIAAMRQKHAKSWYKTTTFKQVTTIIDRNGNKEISIWHEALAMPGRLRIDFDPISDGNGILFTRDNLYQIKNGKVERSQPMVHPLLLLGFDVYFIPVDQTVAKLKGLKFDLSILRQDKWQDRSVYVVGAKAGDLQSPQFWIDKERLYFVRMIRPEGSNGERTGEVQFNRYVRLGKGWIAPEVIFLTDGKISMTETYSEMEADVTLDEKLFDPDHWTTAKHWKQ